ncbi:MAG TPA: deoxynucleoside kinase [Acidobacteriaceae bacterium]|nr:deoxynucleoside kinase [Acidobacteriaceae bacterium]
MTNLLQQHRYIAIEGPIRAGKSTLARLLAQHLDAQCMAEPEGNPFLQRFYRGEKDTAFATQMWFLHARHQQLQALAPHHAPTPVVADYIFAKDKIFASLNLSDTELAIYNRYYQQFSRHVGMPDLVIYLQASPRTLKTRMRRKGAVGEREISDTYLEQIARAYDHFFFHYTASDLLVVNTDDIDFVKNHHDLQLLLRRLSQPVRGTQYFLPLGTRAKSA